MVSCNSQYRPLRSFFQLLLRNFVSSFCVPNTVSLLIQRSGIGLLSMPGATPTPDIMMMCSHDFLSFDCYAPKRSLPRGKLPSTPTAAHNGMPPSPGWLRHCPSSGAVPEPAGGCPHQDAGAPTRPDVVYLRPRPTSCVSWLA